MFSRIKRGVLVFSSLVAIFSSAYAEERSFYCDKVKIHPYQKSDGLYHFTLKQVCTYKNRYLEGVVEKYREVLNNQEDTEVLSEKIVMDTEDKEQAKLKIIQKIRTNHGRMTLHADIELESTQKKLFKYQLQSTKIRGTGHTANTKSAFESLVAKQIEESLQLHFEKKVSIKKPWIAPEGIFVSEVKKGLLDDMKRLVEAHSNRF